MSDKPIVLRDGHFAGLNNITPDKGDGQDLKTMLGRLAGRLNTLLSVFPGMLTASVTNDFANLADGAGASLDVTCPGAAVGDFALASLGVPLQGMTISAVVKAADTVTVRLQNESGGALNLVAATVTVGVIPLNRAQFFGLRGIATWNPAELADAASESTDVTVTGAALGDFAIASLGVDTQGILLTANVVAANTVAVHLQNETAGTLDLASSTCRVLVIPKTALDVVGSIVNDFAELADGAGASLDVPCVGARLGHFALASLAVDVVDMVVSAHVKENNVITVRVQNETGAPVDLAETTVRVAALPPPAFAALLGSQFTVA